MHKFMLCCLFCIVTTLVSSANVHLSDFTDNILPESSSRRVDTLHQSDPTSSWYLKSNTLYVLALAPNVELEWFIPCKSQRWSLSAEGVVAWWRKKSKEKIYQLQQYSLEGRFWFDKSAEYKKHFIGIYSNAGLYDLGRGFKSGNRGEFCGGGVSYGYALPTKGSFRMEFQLGVGYIVTWFDRYHPQDGHHVYSASKRASYFGPTKAKVSIGWILNRRDR